MLKMRFFVLLPAIVCFLGGLLGYVGAQNIGDLSAPQQQEPACLPNYDWSKCPCPPTCTPRCPPIFPETACENPECDTFVPCQPPPCPCQKPKCPCTPPTSECPNEPEECLSLSLEICLPDCEILKTIPTVLAGLTSRLLKPLLETLCSLLTLLQPVRGTPELASCLDLAVAQIQPILACDNIDEILVKLQGALEVVKECICKFEDSLALQIWKVAIEKFECCLNDVINLQCKCHALKLVKLVICLFNLLSELGQISGGQTQVCSCAVKIIVDIVSKQLVGSGLLQSAAVGNVSTAVSRCLSLIPEQMQGECPAEKCLTIVISCLKTLEGILCSLIDPCKCTCIQKLIEDLENRLNKLPCDPKALLSCLVSAICQLVKNIHLCTPPSNGSSLEICLPDCEILKTIPTVLAGLTSRLLKPILETLCSLLTLVRPVCGTPELVSCLDLAVEQIKPICACDNIEDILVKLQVAVEVVKECICKFEDSLALQIWKVAIEKFECCLNDVINLQCKCQALKLVKLVICLFNLLSELGQISGGQTQVCSCAVNIIVDIVCKQLVGSGLLQSAAVGKVSTVVKGCLSKITEIMKSECPAQNCLTIVISTLKTSSGIVCPIISTCKCQCIKNIIEDLENSLNKLPCDSQALLSCLVSALCQLIKNIHLCA